VWLDGVDTASVEQPSTSVPEPGTLALFGMATGLAGFASRRKRAAKTV
jgi:hypothetical protein